MNVCAKCFSDKELIGYIGSFEKTGECDICNNKEEYIIQLDELQDFFQELVDNYQPDKSGVSFKNKIQGNWSLFSNHKSASEILNNLLPKLNTTILNADFKVNYISDILDNISYWETLKEELKWEKRFLTDIVHLTEDLGWDGFFNTQYQLGNDISLYRARVHHTSGQKAFEKNEMNCPPKEKVNGGRANSLGIPTLYLSDNEETVLYEVRASYLDELTIGEFKLNSIESIKIVDFTEDTDLFQPERVNETIKGKLLREKISSDLSKPMRRYDSEIEYIPTQFICEFIKVFTGAKGIRFQSSLHPKGKNLVIFNQKLMKCIAAKLVQVNNISLKSIGIETQHNNGNRCASR
ncbi:RES family NAD+ phosphorylase [Salinimicrobium sp. TIG7-5_MAKvit]|uniref:RES family NAD+ phosphorylase n=1 Tax=Salinimicrobium sp. TIG7-5_MAKvit TaxID=3121289 RepID=UPI003C6DD5B1